MVKLNLVKMSNILNQIKFVVIAFAIFCASNFSLQAQQKQINYNDFIKIADSLFEQKAFLIAAQTYSKAFESIGWKGVIEDRYAAACCWALANIPDSAFYQLYRIATKANFKGMEQILGDTDLFSLHKHKEWLPLIEIIKQNKEKAEKYLDKKLVVQLDSLGRIDQQFRAALNHYNWGTNAYDSIVHLMSYYDSLNTIEVAAILDKYGWLGPEVVGEDGSSTLFLVIQHAQIPTQIKYLPMMREAVKNGKAFAGNLALLEDRVALRQGKKQIYGSQVMRDMETGKFFVQPLEDPENVDKRRKEVGLQPLAEYLMHWNIIWDTKEYLKQLPVLEKKYMH